MSLENSRLGPKQVVLMHGPVLLMIGITPRTQYVLVPCLDNITPLLKTQNSQSQICIFNKVEILRE